MKKISFVVLLTILFLNIYAAKSTDGKPSVLIFFKTNGYHHSCIPAGIAAIKKLGQENGFNVDATDDSLSFTKDNLKHYAALIFLCPTGKVFGPDQEEALKKLY